MPKWAEHRPVDLREVGLDVRHGAIVAHGRAVERAGRRGTKAGYDSATITVLAVNSRDSDHDRDCD
jgi:hypothetical protein